MQSVHDLFVAAAKAGNLRKLKALDGLHNISITTLIYAAIAAATQNRLKTLSWLVHYSPDILRCVDIARGAVENGNIRLLNFLLQRGANFSSSVVVAAAVADYRPAILDWLDKHQLVPQSIDWEWGYKIGDITVLSWLSSRIDSAKMEAFFSCVAINFGVNGLEWLKTNTNFTAKQLHKLPGFVHVMKHCFKFGEIEKLEWLRQHFVKDEIVSLEHKSEASQYWILMAKRGHVGVMEWMKTHYGIELLWLVRHGIIRHAATCGKVQVLQWLHNNQQLPADLRDCCAYWIRSCGHHDTLVWHEQVFGKTSWQWYELYCVRKFRPERRLRLQEHAYDCTDKSVFVEAGMYNEWRTIDERRWRTNLLTLLLCSRRRKIRHLPPELWEQIMGPLMTEPIEEPATVS
jgi:hypothetical protein